MKDHAVLSREAQIDLGKRICALCQKRYGTNFSSEFQGAGVVVILKIVGSDSKLIQRIRTYLKVSFKLILKQDGKNHGSGMKCTILTNLSEVSHDSVRRINDNFREIYNGDGAEKIKQIVVEDKSVPAVIEEPTAEAVLSKRRIKKRDEGHYAITVAISSVFRFEKLPPDFSCKKTDNLYEVFCKNKQVADSVEKILNWRINDPGLIVRNENSFLIDYLNRKQKDETRSNLVFCCAPTNGNQDTTGIIEDIKKRLMKISQNSRPSVTFSKEGEFLVTYVRATIVAKVYPAILLMGWNVKENTKNSFYVYPDCEVSRGLNQDNSTEESQPVFERRDDFDLRIATSLHENYLSINKDEALIELKRIYQDPVLCPLISEGTKKDIFKVLEEDWRKNNPEEYARMLLGILNK